MGIYLYLMIGKSYPYHEAVYLPAARLSAYGWRQGLKFKKSFRSIFRERKLFQLAYSPLPELAIVAPPSTLSPS